VREVAELEWEAIEEIDAEDILAEPKVCQCSAVRTQHPSPRRKQLGYL